MNPTQIRINFDDAKHMSLDELEDAMLEQRMDIKSIEAHIEWQEITNQDIDPNWLARSRKAIKWKETYLMVLSKFRKMERRRIRHENSENYQSLLLELFMREADQDLIDKLTARASSVYPKPDFEDED